MDLKLYRSAAAFADSKTLSSSSPNVGLSIGNFDGFHLGHGNLIDAITKPEIDLSVVLSFRPHPTQYFSGKKHLPLANIRERTDYLSSRQVGAYILERFNQQLADLEAEEFLETYLGELIQPKLVVLGEDFRFGKERRGNIELIRSWCKGRGVEFKAVKPLSQGGKKRSSSEIINSIKLGDFQAAKSSLGRPWKVKARIIKGDQRGRTLGFPTANCLIKNRILPPNGVYALQAKLRGRVYKAVANLGFRPTVIEGQPKPSLEVHLIDYPETDSEFYGEFLELEFLKFLREEKKFSDIDELKTQISLDLTQAQEFFQKKNCFDLSLKFHIADLSESPGAQIANSEASSTPSKRLDKLLTDLLDELPDQENEPGIETNRSKCARWIKEGRVSLDGHVETKASFKVKAAGQIDLSLPIDNALAFDPDTSIPLNVIYEDPSLLVINKQVGLVVHPGAGNPDGTLVHALTAHLGDEIRQVGDTLRPGIVHRLDKDTSGLMVIAKTEKAFLHLRKQFDPPRTIHRTYQAFALRTPTEGKKSGEINFSLARSDKDRRMFCESPAGKTAKTHWKVLETLKHGMLFEITLETGRTHQIRSHFHGSGAALLGDPLYLPKISGVPSELARTLTKFPRQALHASKLKFLHPETGQVVSFEVEMPNDMLRLKNILN